ncbi:glycosyltransferase 87 family protein [Catenuloplanes atrovinosus]|uniref:Alpha-1,2-mannosyltransferase n=1 Tax=Catenuloplanes atrovinosus TaxID=137266 RepID=A0AAE3YJF6_9ACTN|nr:glycosyltransferase 87 family protein [Catenuloplanes atrovinosus]MDR7273406.1 alpha-1,2-mannosyltransferase [Catenuloplanes atrovinosus]
MRTLWRVAGVVLFAVVVAVFDLVTSARHGFFDLKVYWGALNYWANDGGMLYDYLNPNTLYGFTYPPFAAFVMLPMAWVSWPAAITISVVATVVVSALLVWWLIRPIAQRQGWTPWLAFAIAACLVAAYEPMRETVNFGQVNMLLLFLVAVDVLFLVGRGSPLGGVGIGLATAIKLTPGVFIIYLLVTGRWRAAITASGTAAFVTLVAAVIAPDASREFWTSALWNTDRVGDLGFISNQSFQGVIARLFGDDVKPLWALLVVATLIFWGWRCRAAVRAGDERAGLALTAVLGCLISPVTWVHHLVWLLPALFLIAGGGFRATGRRRRVMLAIAFLSWAVLCSRLVWLWTYNTGGLVGLLGGSAYVWISILLLVAIPIEPAPAAAAEDQDLAEGTEEARPSLVA